MWALTLRCAACDLPYRQLRKVHGEMVCVIDRDLPYRQLRKDRGAARPRPLGDLPHRQLIESP